MTQINQLFIGLLIGSGLTAGAFAQNPATAAAPIAGPGALGPKDWQVPDITKLPDDKYGQLVRQGKALMESTYKHIGPEVKDVSKRYAGNNLSCVACHMESGGRKFGNPWVGTFVSFPQYRGREDAIATTEERVNGCMERSMNGRKLPLDSEEMKAMMSYLHFLSTGIPVGAKLEGGGTLKLKALARALPILLPGNSFIRPRAWPAMAQTAKACDAAKWAMPMVTSFRRYGVQTAITMVQVWHALPWPQALSKAICPVVSPT